MGVDEEGQEAEVSTGVQVGCRWADEGGDAGNRGLWYGTKRWWARGGREKSWCGETGPVGGVGSEVRLRPPKSFIWGGHKERTIGKTPVRAVYETPHTAYSAVRLTRHHTPREVPVEIGARGGRETSIRGTLGRH